jgi:hypothetical protein
MMRPAAASLLLLVACGTSDAPPASEQATITDSAGITVVQNHRPVWGEGEGWQVSAEPLLVIADTMATGDGRYVMSAARLSTGGVVVLTDNGGRWFDAAGTFVRPFAPKGEGPGEFTFTTSLFVLADDSVAVGAAGWRAKVAVFDSTGSLAREVFYDSERLAALGRWEECGSRVLPDFSLTNCKDDPSIPVTETNRPSRMVGDGWTSPGPGLWRRRARVFRIPESLDTVFPLGIEIGIEQQIVDVGDGLGKSIVHPFHSRSSLAANGAPMRIAIAENPHWEIEVFSGEGRKLQIIRRDGGRRAPNEAESKWADSAIRSPGGRFYTQDPVERGKLLAEMQVPDSLPGHQGILLTTRGEIFSRQWTYWEMGAPSLFDVFDADGRWLGTLTLPSRFRLIEGGEDYLLGVRFDEDDVPSVVMYGLKR